MSKLVAILKKDHKLQHLFNLFINLYKLQHQAQQKKKSKIRLKETFPRTRALHSQKQTEIHECQT